MADKLECRDTLSFIVDMGRKYLIITSVLLFFIFPVDVSCEKQKTVKLIVPHKIKYIHHTHVLLVKPKKKKIAHLREGAEDEEASYRSHHYRQDTSHARTKPHVHYILPYVTSAKEGAMYHTKGEPYSVDSYHRRKIPTEEVPGKPKPPKLNKSYQGPQRFKTDSSMHHASYLMKPTNAEQNAPNADYLNPKYYETKYLGYNTFSEGDSTDLGDPYLASDSSFYDSTYNGNNWGLESYVVPGELNKPDGSAWGDTTYSFTGKPPIDDYYESLQIPPLEMEAAMPKEVHTGGWGTNFYKYTEKSPVLKLMKSYSDNY